MEPIKINYKFKTHPWLYNGTGGWTFVSIPIEISTEIRDIFKSEEQGWGRLKIKAKIGETEWKTAIWFDTKHNTYLLPLKAEIRKKENIVLNKTINVNIWI